MLYNHPKLVNSVFNRQKNIGSINSSVIKRHHNQQKQYILLSSQSSNYNNGQVQSTSPMASISHSPNKKKGAQTKYESTLSQHHHSSTSNNVNINNGGPSNTSMTQKYASKHGNSRDTKNTAKPYQQHKRQGSNSTVNQQMLSTSDRGGGIK